MTKTPKTIKTPPKGKPAPPEPKSGGAVKKNPAASQGRSKNRRSPARAKSKRGPGRPKITEAQKRLFLAELEKGRTVQSGCEAGGFHRTAAYAHRSRSDLFRQAWDAAYEIGTDRLEEAATSRAFIGSPRKIYMKVGIYENGKRVGEHIVNAGEDRVYSDRLMEIMLRKRRPQEFREKVDHTHSGKKGAPPIAFRDVSVKDLSNEQLADLERRLLSGDSQRALPTSGEAGPAEDGEGGDNGA